MTAVQRVAQVIGWVFILIGIIGFFYSGTSMEADPDLAPKVLGLFPVNVLHNLVHLGFGVWGVMAARSFAAARDYGRIAGIAYLALAALAFLSPSMFGLVPIGGHDIWLHVLLGVVLAGAGFTATPPDGTAPATTSDAAAAAPPGTRTTATETPPDRPASSPAPGMGTSPRTGPETGAGTSPGSGPGSGPGTSGGAAPGGGAAGGAAGGGTSGGMTGGSSGGSTGSGTTGGGAGAGGASAPEDRPPAGPPAPPPTIEGEPGVDRPASPPDERDRMP